MKKLSNKRLASLVKKANQRLRQIEKSDLTDSRAYQYIVNKAYDSDKALGTTKKGQIKFRTDVAKFSWNEQQHLVSLVQGFLNAKTSTVTGINKTYKKRVEKFAKSVHRTDIKYSEWFKLYDIARLNDYHKKLSSDNVDDIVTDLMRDAPDIDEAIKFLYDNAENDNYKDTLDNLNIKKEEWEKSRIEKDVKVVTLEDLIK